MKTLKDMFATAKKPAVISAVVIAAVVASTGAHAAYTIPSAITTAFADMLDAWKAVEDLVWPVVGAVIIGMFVMRKVKQGANKA